MPNAGLLRNGKVHRFQSAIGARRLRKLSLSLQVPFAVRTAYAESGDPVPMHHT